jgi:magnesium-transporting ATPase (P-type)
MNNVIDRNYNRNTGRENNIYNEAFGERLVSFFCIIIAFFESSAVNAICRVVCAVAVLTGIFFYVSALIAGTLAVSSVLIYGFVLIAASALLFKTDIKRS